MNLFKRFLVALLLVFYTHFHLTDAEEQVGQLPHCNNEDNSPGLILVSTLDGTLAALSTNGELLWELETGPLLLSNIHKLELTNNGQWVRIIPSLSGSLYKFDGSNIDAIPVTADHLLTSSFKYSDDMVIAGGKEIRSYAVSLNSGKKIYECSIEGCKNNTEVDDSENIVIIEKSSYVVRAVEPRTGTERWNFSVAIHNVKIPFTSCINIDSKLLDYKIRAILPDGHIMVNSDTTLYNAWDYKFSSPIVAIWKWDGRNLHQVDLFEVPIDPNNPTSLTPAIYVGMHKKQLYVFESERMKEVLHSKPHTLATVLESKSVTSIPWKPISVTSVALVPVDDSDGSTALSVLYSSEYINGNGFYLYTSKDLQEENSLTCDNITVSDIVIDVIVESSTTISRWMEIVAISLLAVVIINLILYRVMFNWQFSHSSKNLLNIKEENRVHNERQLLPLHARTSSESSTDSFVSRYLTEFVTISCLGKGGFGVVFHVKKKFDDCDYAVKRITLPEEDEARERVMREVKTLAKLDHKHIVRYYNAWTETPPVMWQKMTDNKQFSEITSTMSSSKSSRPHQRSSSVSIDIENLRRQKEAKQITVAEDDSVSKEASKICSIEDELRLQKQLSSDSFIVFEEDKPKNQLSKQDDCSDKESLNTHTSTITSHNQKKINWQKPGRRSHSVDITSQGRVAVTEMPTTYLYIQMQLCQEESLKDWLRKNTQRDKTFLLDVFKQIVEAVEYVHLHGLIHRDLKPSNIFFSLEGQVKIGDFGLVTAIQDAPVIDKGTVPRPSSAKSYTAAVGTTLYMSPEQFKGEKYNYKVDIYSLGVILFELLIPFSTEMERVTMLTDLRKKIFPVDFPKEHHKEKCLLWLMLNDNPKARPTTFGIRARPPFLQEDAIAKPEFHFELPKIKNTD